MKCCDVGKCTLSILRVQLLYTFLAFWGRKKRRDFFGVDPKKVRHLARSNPHRASADANRAALAASAPSAARLFHSSCKTDLELARIPRHTEDVGHDYSVDFKRLTRSLSGCDLSWRKVQPPHGSPTPENIARVATPLA